VAQYSSETLKSISLGNIDATKQGSKWLGYIITAIEQLKDTKIYQVISPFKDKSSHSKRDQQEPTVNNWLNLLVEISAGRFQVIQMHLIKY
jgi:hypothetical protein